MKKTAAMVGLGLILAGMEAFGQAALPTFYSGPWKEGPLPAGWTANGLRSSDYADNYDGIDGNAAGLDSAGDWVKINISGAPATVSYWTKGNSLSGEYTFKVQESSNGSSWTDVAVFNSGNPIPNSPAIQHTNNLLATTRYVQFIYVAKAAGNVGLDGVKIQGPGAPSISFDPQGSPGVPVSNTFTMAVSITPAGSGMQSWILTPADRWEGEASLTNGLFSMTPAPPATYWDFTLTVVATNIVGTTTGSVMIGVTPYEPPMPVVSFSPAAPYQITAGQTQRLGIAVSPIGSGISGWTMTPSNYTGTASLVGTNFIFASSTADGPATYELSVMATNEHGSRTGTVSILLREYVPPPPAGTYIASFEDGSKTGYAAENVTLSNKTWELAGILIGTVADDKKIGSKSARLKFDPADGPETMTSQSTLLNNGIGWMALWYGPYGTHGANAPVLAIEISDNPASGWIEVGEVDAGAVEELTYASFDVYVNTPVYVRIRAKSGTVGRSANFDNVTITPYVSPASNPYDAYLLKYNVTPGDPGTAPGEDWDGDGFTNQQEFEASPQTNPYDADSHP